MAAAAQEQAQRRRKGAAGLGEGKGSNGGRGRAAVRRRPGGHRSSRGGSRSARGGWGGSGHGAPTSCLSGHSPTAHGLGRRPDWVPFPQNIRVPRLPEFADWAHKSGNSSTIFFDKGFCQRMIEEIGPRLEGEIPVSRGLPIPEVFTLKPLEFGKPNTLVCFVSNLFPPALTVNWQHQAAPVEGVGPTFVSAVDGLSFQAFSYLNFTPTPYDLFSCIVTHEIDSYTAIAYWVPQNALPSDLLENVLCGVAFGLGVLGIIVGLVLIIYFRKPCLRD
ncbi:HLA class II histocompatibility antigen, DM alpha chain isoform X1 [Vicugna pacos]|uniref:HLA class II histocompatibility antigen, DM alpha chain isoform X1 n=1 Tax=Vicugna pacos TaxID=30538 RepID=A0A6J3BI35_VICPA